MEGLNGQTTSVEGSGKMEWDIEDQLGVQDTIVNNAHHVPQANIRLFSPQIHIQEQSGSSNHEPSLMLNSKGITLGLGDGNSLSFPVQTSTTLWPFAVDQAIYIWNRIPWQDSKTSPLEHFSGPSGTRVLFCALAHNDVFSVRTLRDCIVFHVINVPSA